MHGLELWRSNGTKRGTKLAVDIRRGPASSDPSQFVNLTRRMLFVAQDTRHGYELWSTNGTRAGTRRLSDIAPGPQSARSAG